MTDCIFCKIIKEEIPSSVIWEDEDHFAFLDINPSCRGMTIVIPKKHYGSYIFNEEDETINSLMKATKLVAKKLEKTLGVKRIIVVFEGLEIDHLHVKLYPYYEGQNFTADPGARADPDDLSILADQIKQNM